MSLPADQIQASNDPDGIEVIGGVAKVLGGRLKNVKAPLLDGSVRVRQLRAEHLGHQIEILADHESVHFDIEARFGQFTLLYVNPWKEHRWGGRPAACTILALDTEYRVYTYGNKLSPEQTQLVESEALKRLVEVIQLRPEESMLVSQRLFSLDLKRPSVERALAAIHAVINLMPHESSKRFTPYDELPSTLQPLVPFISKWGISDDEKRWQKIQRSASSTRQKLVDTVVPLLPAIDEYLDTFKGASPSPEACELGNVAQAALEVQRLLKE